MLNLKNLPDEEFSIVVTPPIPQSNVQLTINQSGHVYLSSKLAQHFSKKPVQLSFNRDYTAVQLLQLSSESDPNCLIFPKNGRKLIPNAAELLQGKRIPFPAVFQGPIMSDTAEKWRGGYHKNPTAKSSNDSRNTKKS